MSADNPILNNPYDEPKCHYSTDADGQLDYQVIREGRRSFMPDLQAIPVRQGAQRSLMVSEDLSAEYQAHPINLLRKEVGNWRNDNYPGITRVTKELLDFWFDNPDRHAELQLFFAQREAIEAAIWLNEIAPKVNVGQHLLSLLQDARSDHMNHGGSDAILPRIAFKMATGTGKTVVMAALILYHFFNRQEYRQDTRFADYFLIVTPGITIRDRLSVLIPNESKEEETQDYYHRRWLVPRNRESMLPNLTARIVITNYQSFLPRTLQGNKRSPMDGKLDGDGRKQDAREDMTDRLKKVLGQFRENSRLLIFNDEAHHCYLPREKGKSVEGEDTKTENERAAVWFSGIKETAKRYKVSTVYDLSATPYYLTGSGFDPYSLFPWTVTDFGLIEAIESGLVKIPFLPESDPTQHLTMPVLRDLYRNIPPNELPRKGRKTTKAEARKEGKEEKEAPPNLPGLVKQALDMFYKHYKDSYDQIRDLFQHPPVFIAVCINTSVSKEMYKYIAGYEWTDDDGETHIVPGVFDLFSNYDPSTLQPIPKPPTLLIDSSALEESNQVSPDFKKVFAREIEIFKRDYSRTYGQTEGEKLTDGDILREVVNTVGRTGLLGAHIRCVVSVSMLTEGWDANTVTHVMGLRPFNSQLLCEQVAGRALRRQNYTLVGYDKDGEPTDDKRRIATWKFPPEYAHIIGIPFNSFKSGTTVVPPVPPQWLIYPIPERKDDFEITFPNVVGYRVENRESPLTADFSEIEPYTIDGSTRPLDTRMATAFSPETDVLTIRERINTLRDQELIFLFTKEMLSHYYRDEDKQPEFHRFAQVKRIVEEWYATKVRVLAYDGDMFKRLLYYENASSVCAHIKRGIDSAQRSTDVILPILNYYNPEGSTEHVRGKTSRNVYPTKKSHINYVVADTDTWEQIAAKSLDDEDMDDIVISYVKNAYLNFTIPYVDKFGRDKSYYPDFIARCRTPDGNTINLVIEITGMNEDKIEKRWFVDNRWIPSVNTVRDKHGYDEWRFLEVAEDIRDIKNKIRAKVRESTP